MSRDMGGYVLLAALWLLIALSAITLQVGLRGRESRLAVANRVEAVRGRAVADAGLEQARAILSERVRGSVDEDGTALLDPWLRLEGLLPARGTIQGTAEYSLSARDLGALVNLNRVDELGFRRLLTALGVDDGRADRISQAVMDWRDADDLRHARGAERDDYLEAGLPTLPTNAPFRRVEELRSVLGMSGEVYDLVAPALTVVGSGRVNLASAPIPVLRSLPGMEPSLIRAVLEQRRRGPLGSIAQVGARLPSAERESFEAHLPELLARTTVQTQELEVVSEGGLEGDLRRVRRAAVVTRSGNAVFMTRELGR